MRLVIKSDHITQIAFHHLLSVILFLIASAPLVYSECNPIYVFNGEGLYHKFGHSVASAGDVNRDGYDDLIIGAPGIRKAYVFSGLDGDTLYLFQGETDFVEFGFSVASAGDVNNDGYADIIVGASGNAGRAYVFSGINGDTLHVFTGRIDHEGLGYSVASAGDVNNDGYDDLIIGSHNEVSSNKGWAYVFSGLNGDTLHLFKNKTAFDEFGKSVSSAGDVNNDGYADLIVGAPKNGQKQSYASFNGRAYVFSGFNGDTLHIFNGEFPGDAFGNSVAYAGDVNNDGFIDLIVGAPEYDGNGKNNGRAYVFSGQNGARINVFEGALPADYFGLSVASAGDVDNDGHADLIVGAERRERTVEIPGRAYVFSGSDSIALHIFTGQTATDEVVSVASAGDVNKDGISDLIVGAPFGAEDGSRAGRAYVYSGAPGNCCCGALTANIDCDPNSAIDIADLTVLIDHLFLSLAPLCCYDEGNIDGDPNGEVTLADFTRLVDLLFLSHTPPAVCK